jgi:hypothetical protein
LERWPLEFCANVSDLCEVFLRHDGIVEGDDAAFQLLDGSVTFACDEDSVARARQAQGAADGEAAVEFDTAFGTRDLAHALEDIASE